MLIKKADDTITYDDYVRAVAAKVDGNKLKQCAEKDYTEIADEAMNDILYSTEWDEDFEDYQVYDYIGQCIENSECYNVTSYIYDIVFAIDKQLNSDDMNFNNDKVGTISFFDDVIKQSESGYDSLYELVKDQSVDLSDYIQDVRHELHEHENW